MRRAEPRFPVAKGRAVVGGRRDMGFPQGVVVKPGRVALIIILLGRTQEEQVQTLLTDHQRV